MGSPHSFILLHIFAVLLLLICAPSANGAITNTTVDDTSSAFTFTGSWTAVSASNPCDFCSSKPDVSQTFGASWHDGNYRTGASETTGGSFTFTGSAVYIFGIDQAQSQPDVVFTLGSTQSTHHSTGTERFAYNALFFSATGLPADQTHTVNWIFNIDQSTGVGVQAALFDYAIVTSGTADATPQAQKPSTTTTKAQGKIASPTSSSSSISSSSKSTANGQTLSAAIPPSSSSANTGATQSKSSLSSGIALSATSVPCVFISRPPSLS
ncbi:hypothetical protein DFH08DRAFT_95957 [Mycena albidolilacea]|uniref:Uncharacterized protein n=1 Tax=Mycena albidolilacea TaxID=1033008 RepID=A0AAD6YZC1_9AGAR|nr:hypothetical protein DFH08DRAFT_95957 [Mycena albidolilacea]